MLQRSIYAFVPSTCYQRWFVDANRPRKRLSHPSHALKLVFLAKFVTRTSLGQLARSTSHTNLLCRVLGAIGPIAFTNHLSWQLEVQTGKGFLFPFQSTDLMPVVGYVLLFFRDQSKHLTYHQGSLHRPRRKKTGSAADHPPSFRIDQSITVIASFRAN
jgi:hypothetical protein